MRYHRYREGEGGDEDGLHRTEVAVKLLSSCLKQETTWLLVDSKVSLLFFPFLNEMR